MKQLLDSEERGRGNKNTNIGIATYGIVSNFAECIKTEIYASDDAGKTDLVENISK